MSAAGVAGRQASVRLRPNAVLATLVLLALAGVLLLGFAGFAPNRILTGRAVALWDAVGASTLFAFAIAGGVLVAGTLASRHGLAALGAAGLLGATLWGAGDAAQHLSLGASPAARVSLGGAFWALLLASCLAANDAIGRLPRRLSLRVALLVGAVLLLAILGGRGHFDQLSIVREWANRRDAYGAELARHLLLVAGALVPAVVIGVPLGLLALRRPGLSPGLFAALNLVQTIPSIALFGLLIGPLTVLADAVPVLRTLGIGGVGAAPAVIALVLYALLPVARNTHAALRQVPPAVVDAARGMGMTAAQVLYRVSLPLALPVLLSGLRIVLVQLIGLTVVAALIGAGGLGTFVFQGLGQTATDLVLLGAVSTIVLALAADLVLRAAVLLLKGEVSR